MKNVCYEVCHVITVTLLLGKPDKKRRCIILTGEPNSGKSTLGRYTAGIFESHYKKETRSIFDQ